MGEETVLLIATMTQVFLLNTANLEAEPERIYEGKSIQFALPTESGSALIIDGSTLILWDGKKLKTYSTGITEDIDSAAVLREKPLRVLIGTVGPHLYTWKPGQDLAMKVESFEDLEVRDKWHTPWGGPASVRSLAISSDGHVYADIHVGSIMRSPDGGKTWEPVTPTLNEDVHQVTACPSAPKSVFANTANGVYISPDHGNSWTHRPEGMKHLYGRAIAVHPRDPQVMIAANSRGPHGKDVQARLYRSDNGGETWLPVDGEFPETSPGNIDTHHIAFAAEGNAFASVGDHLYIGKDKGSNWKALWKAPGDITLVRCP